MRPRSQPRPAELMVLSVDDGNLKIANAKRNAHSSATPKPTRTVQELPLKELQGEGARLVELFHSGLVKLPKSIRNLEAGAFKAVAIPSGNISIAMPPGSR